MSELTLAEKHKRQILRMEMARHYSFTTIWARRYADMKARIEGQRSKRSASYGKELLTKDEFMVWCKSKVNFIQFMVIYMEWVNSDFNTFLSPSVDRIDNNKGYTVDNMQWVTYLENTQKHDKPPEWSW